MECFDQKGFFLSAYQSQKLVGGMIVLIHDHVGNYFYTCTTKKGRELQVPSGLTYQAIELAKEERCDIFDFCSVYDERYPKQNKRWKGFTEFKRRFMPTDIYFPVTFTRGIF